MGLKGKICKNGSKMIAYPICIHSALKNSETVRWPQWECIAMVTKSKVKDTPLKFA